MIFSSIGVDCNREDCHLPCTINKYQNSIYSCVHSVGHNDNTERGGGELVCDQFKRFYILLINQSISNVMLPITLSYSSVKS